MILLYEVAHAGPFMTVYRDHENPRAFYYLPQFAEVRKFPSDGRLAFGATLFRKDPSDPNDGFSLYHVGVVGVVPSDELAKTLRELQQQYGTGVTINPVPAYEVSLEPITEGIYRSIKCQSHGGNIFTDVATSFTVDESLEPDMSRMFQDAVGWEGVIRYKVQTRKTAFDWKITANWHAVQEHFKAQTSVRWWFINTNLSYETQTLIARDMIHVDVTGGAPSDKEKVYAMAERIAGRLFQRSLQPAPLPDHPSGAVVCLSVNYSKVEENKSSEWSGTERDFEERSLGMSVYVRQIPREYFKNFDSPGVAVFEPGTDTHALAHYRSSDELVRARSGAGRMRKATKEKRR